MILSLSKGTTTARNGALGLRIAESDMPKSDRGQSTAPGSTPPKRVFSSPEAEAKAKAGLRPPWPKGKSANPGGRAVELIKPALRAMADWIVNDETIPRFEALWPGIGWEEFRDLTLAQALALSQLAAGIAGETRAADFAADRIDGPVVRRVDVTSEGKRLAESGTLSSRLLALLGKATPPKPEEPGA